MSIKTVSRVVNGESTVAPALATQVRAAVESLNYQPHIGASMLRRGDGRTGTIGLLLEDVGNPFSAARCTGPWRTRPAPAACRCSPAASTRTRDRERELARAFAARRADGLIIAPAGADQ